MHGRILVRVRLVERKHAVAPNMVTQQPLLARSDTVDGVKQKVDIEFLAQNSGRAMLRYREKKKT